MKARLVSNKAFKTILDEETLALSFIVKDNYEISRILAKIGHLNEIEITISEYRKKRSLEQNKMLWRLIDKISLTENGSKQESEVMNVYSRLLEMANVKYDFILALKEAENSLRNNFRAVIDMKQSRIVNNQELNIYKVYYGSSNFNTKEMSELIDFAIEYAYQIGVTELEIGAIKDDYRL